MNRKREKDKHQKENERCLRELAKTRDKRLELEEVAKTSCGKVS